MISDINKKINEKVIITGSVLQVTRLKMILNDVFIVTRDVRAYFQRPCFDPIQIFVVRIFEVFTGDVITILLYKTYKT